MAAPTRAASAPIAPATGAFLRAAPERVDEVVLLVVFPVPLDGGAVVEGREVPGAEVMGVEVPGVPEAEAEGVPEGAPLEMETMGGVTVSIQG